MLLTALQRDGALYPAEVLRHFRRRADSTRALEAAQNIVDVHGDSDYAADRRSLLFGVDEHALRTEEQTEVGCAVLNVW